MGRMGISIRIMACAMLGTCVTHGGIIGANSLVSIVRASDLIVVGTVPVDLPSSQTLSFQLQIDRVVKGDPALSGQVVSVLWTPGSGTRGEAGPSTVKRRGLWFLKSSAGGWSLLPLLNGDITVSEAFFLMPPGAIPDAYAYGPDVPVSERVAREICAAVEYADGGILMTFYNTPLLDELGSPMLQTLYTRMSASTFTPRRIFGLSGLSGREMPGHWR